ncbi:hypothetical protein Bbelb_349500 [Branchiostoma belcheri]|nr:hypothetical protein Bbelb_349500 [Branchiostoma belcheri]
MEEEARNTHWNKQLMNMHMDSSGGWQGYRSGSLMEWPALEYADSLGDVVTGNLVGLHKALSDRFGVAEMRQKALDELVHCGGCCGMDTQIPMGMREKMGVNLFVSGLEPSRLVDKLGRPTHDQSL